MRFLFLRYKPGLRTFTRKSTGIKQMKAECAFTQSVPERSHLTAEGNGIY